MYLAAIHSLLQTRGENKFHLKWQFILLLGGHLALCLELGCEAASRLYKGEHRQALVLSVPRRGSDTSCQPSASLAGGSTQDSEPRHPHASSQLPQSPTLLLCWNIICFSLYGGKKGKWIQNNTFRTFFKCLFQINLIFFFKSGIIYFYTNTLNVSWFLHQWKLC